MTRTIITIVGGLYVVLGLSFVLPALHALIALLISGFQPLIALYVSFLCVHVVLCGLIGYAFLARRPWGRFLVVCYNSFWLLALLSNPVARILSGRALWLTDTPLAGHIIAIAAAGALIGIILLCCRGSVRVLLTK